MVLILLTLAPKKCLIDGNYQDFASLIRLE